VQYDLHVGDEGRGVIIMSRFTPGELKVMRLLWEHGELKPAELQERFPEPIKNPALRSYLTTLLEKGHVTRRRVGKAYYYKAATRSRSGFRTMLGELVDAYCGGSARALVMNIIKAERLSADELLELKRLADGGDLTPQPPHKRRRK
jgi:predicted transcriptional regulator